jgi:hypothetical protein
MLDGLLSFRIRTPTECRVVRGAPAQWKTATIDFVRSQCELASHWHPKSALLFPVVISPLHPRRDWWLLLLHACISCQHVYHEDARIFGLSLAHAPTRNELTHMHYRNLALCRVPYSLPSVLFRALGKELFAECHAKKPSVKENTRRRSSQHFFLFFLFLCPCSEKLKRQCQIINGTINSHSHMRGENSDWWIILIDNDVRTKIEIRKFWWILFSGLCQTHHHMLRPTSAVQLYLYQDQLSSAWFRSLRRWMAPARHWVPGPITLPYHRDASWITSPILHAICMYRWL